MSAQLDDIGVGGSSPLKPTIS